MSIFGIFSALRYRNYSIAIDWADSQVNKEICPEFYVGKR